MSKLFNVFEVTSFKNGRPETCQIKGIFDQINLVLMACKDSTYFIYTNEINEPFPDIDNMIYRGNFPMKAKHE